MTHWWCFTQPAEQLLEIYEGLDPIPLADVEYPVARAEKLHQLPPGRGETILVVANLARSVQPVELDLAAYNGFTPVEMLAIAGAALTVPEADRVIIRLAPAAEAEGGSAAASTASAGTRSSTSSCARS